MKQTETDLIVVGSGAAGLCAAVTAAIHGKSVIVLEKSDRIGGTTSYSEGMIWVPNSGKAGSRGSPDTEEDALTYLKEVLGTHFEPERLRAYLRSAPAVLQFLESRTRVRYHLAGASIDYYPNRAGATKGLRALSPASFDGRLLGRRDFALLRPPLRVARLFGGMSIAAEDLPHFYRIFRSWASTVRVVQLVARYVRDRLAGWPRGTAIGNGDGLVAALLLALRENGGSLLTGAEVTEVTLQDGRADGVRAIVDGVATRITARHGVVLAAGGFSASAELRRERGAQKGPDNHVVLVAEGATGDGLRMAVSAGAAVNGELRQPFAWAPSSWVPHLGSGFPHFVERAKPGIIAVDPQGRRFVNEAVVYHDFVPAMAEAASRTGGRTEAWLIADHRAQRRYGLGAAPPGPGWLWPSLRSGYLVRAGSVAELANRIAVDPSALDATVARFNAAAVRGEDPDFGRGSSEQNRAYGDPAHRPNPCLAPLETPPFYAVRIQPGDLGSLVGIATDACARVLDEAGRPIPGLYAAGLDAASIFGGYYPAAGVTVGSALVFGWIAARNALSLGNGYAERPHVATA